MFGFLGRPVTKIITEANGESLGSTRPFIVAHAVKESRFQKYTRGYFDINNEGSAPQQEARLSTAFVALTGNPLFTLPVFALSTLVTSDGYAFNYFFNVPGVAEHRGWNFTSGAALSPATRQHRFDFHFPETIFAIAYSDNSSGGSKSSTSNALRGTLNAYIDQFPNAEIFSIQQAFIDTLNFRARPKLKVFILNNVVGLATINGKLPSSVQQCLINESSLTTVATLLSEATGLKHITFGSYASFPTVGGGNNSFSGEVSLSHLTELQEIGLTGVHASVTNWVLPVKTDWLFWWVTNLNGTSSPNFSTSYIDNALASPGLKLFSFAGNAKSITKNIGNTEISSALQYFIINNNSWTGDINITTAKTNLKQFKTGNLTTRTGSQQNSHPVMDITGLTHVTLIDITGSNCEDLELPVNTVCTALYAYDNKLDVGTNTNLVSQIAAMTALTDLRLGNGSNTVAGAVGQNSVNGLGSNPDLSALINCATLLLDSQKITGTLTLPNVNKITSFSVTNNPDLTDINNLTAHTGLLAIRAAGCTDLTYAITNAFTSLFFMILNDSGLTGIDLSGRTSTGTMALNANNCPGLTSITCPTTQATCVFANNGSVTVQNCSALTAMSNMENINYPSASGATNTDFIFPNNALNIEFPFGENNFIPRTIQIQGNGMSQVNVDASINNIVLNADKWDVYTAAKTLNISGSNSTPSGTYQMPPGNNPIGATGKEQLYWLINTKSWAATYTP
jgi:hypothetical protein